MDGRLSASFSLLLRPRASIGMSPEAQSQPRATARDIQEVLGILKLEVLAPGLS